MLSDWQIVVVIQAIASIKWEILEGAQFPDSHPQMPDLFARANVHTLQRCEWTRHLLQFIQPLHRKCALSKAAPQCTSAAT